MCLLSRGEFAAGDGPKSIVIQSLQSTQFFA